MSALLLPVESSPGGDLVLMMCLERLPTVRDLVRCALVSRRWRNASYSCDGWRKLFLSRVSREILNRARWFFRLLPPGSSVDVACVEEQLEISWASCEDSPEAWRERVAREFVRNRDDDLARLRREVFSLMVRSGFTRPGLLPGTFMFGRNIPYGIEHGLRYLTCDLSAGRTIVKLPKLGKPLFAPMPGLSGIDVPVDSWEKFLCTVICSSADEDDDVEDWVRNALQRDHARAVPACCTLANLGALTDVRESWLCSLGLEAPFVRGLRLQYTGSTGETIHGVALETSRHYFWITC